MRFDVLVKGGRLLDPAASQNGALDVAISGGWWLRWMRRSHPTPRTG